MPVIVPYVCDLLFGLGGYAIVVGIVGVGRTLFVELSGQFDQTEKNAYATYLHSGAAFMGIGVAAVAIGITLGK